MGPGMFAATDLDSFEVPKMEALVQRLIEKPKQIFRYPDQQVILTGLSFSMPQMGVMEGSPKQSDLEFLFEHDIIPCNTYQIHHDRVLNTLFCINLQYDQQTRDIIVSRGNHTAKLRHTGQGDLTTGTRKAILGLALLPDELWMHVGQSGFILGTLTEKSPGAPWKGNIWSMSLPDPDGVLSGHTSEPQVLENIDLPVLFRSLHPPQEAYLRILQPVGLFFNLQKTK